MMRYDDGMMVRMQIQFTEEQAAALRAEAARRGCSISSLVRERVGSGAAAPRVSRADALRRVGPFRSGLPDVGLNHDDYLAEDYLA